MFGPLAATPPVTDDPTAEYRDDIEAFVREQVDDLDLPPALDARLRDRIRTLALGQADPQRPPVPAADAGGVAATSPPPAALG